METAGPFVERALLLTGRRIYACEQFPTAARGGASVGGRRVHVMLDLVTVTSFVLERPRVSGRDRSGVKVGHDERGRRGRYAGHLAVGPRKIRYVAQDQPTPQEVEGAVGEGQRAHVARHEYPPNPPLCGEEHLGDEIETHRERGRAGGAQQTATCPASHVQESATRELR